MIDWRRVCELKHEVGEEGFDEVIELFLEEVEEVILKLKAQNRASLEQHLHFLKGSALNLGFRDFSDLCLKGEHAAVAGAADQVDLDKIIAVYDTSKQMFLAEVKTHCA